MLKIFRLTRCFPMDMIKEGYSRFKLCAKDAGLGKRETLSYLFESFVSTVGKDTLDYRMRVFNFKLEADKK